MQIGLCSLSVSILLIFDCLVSLPILCSCWFCISGLPCPWITVGTLYLCIILGLALPFTLRPFPPKLLITVGLTSIDGLFHGCSTFWLLNSCITFWLLTSCFTFWLRNFCIAFWLFHSCITFWLLKSCHKCWFLNSGKLPPLPNLSLLARLKPTMKQVRWSMVVQLILVLSCLALIHYWPLIFRHLDLYVQCASMALSCDLKLSEKSNCLTLSTPHTLDSYW